MPRKQPLPKREREICRRLREFRKFTKLSQAVFARELGMEGSLLASYEHGRAPVRYNLFLSVAADFNLNPDWLASGDGPMVDYNASFRLGGSKHPDQELFSSVYDFVRKNPDTVGHPLHFKTPDAMRSYLHNELHLAVSHWLWDIPDNQLWQFYEWLLSAGEQARLALLGQRALPSVSQQPVAQKDKRQPKAK